MNRLSTLEYNPSIAHQHYIHVVNDFGWGEYQPKRSNITVAIGRGNYKSPGLINHPNPNLLIAYYMTNLFPNSQVTTTPSTLSKLLNMLISEIQYKDPTLLIYHKLYYLCGYL